ncbi:hypothetical protein SO802_007475 [Lithocarpus litseifolius]|uniref:Calponin-homology (CH) domain-containing protein n=1 Tax=Lithocarpus litseifolius TaxID=425828 RepID=A0AAW2DNQ1_9ROSI
MHILSQLNQAIFFSSYFHLHQKFLIILDNSSQKQNSLKSLAKSLSVWLNFLFENPRSCGCGNGDAAADAEEVVSGKGKRDSGCGVGIGVDAAATWQRPKRRRDLLWRKEVDDAVEFPNSMFASLRSSLKDVCSFDDLKERMRSYLSLGCCEDIFKAMTHVTKTIDEGRLKMKAHCPLVTDFGLKEKATTTLMSYNPIWLRIGLYIIFGGNSLLSNVNVNSDQEITFLKMVIEKQFFSHAGLAKAYAYNKMVEGLYRPGYYENLGNVVLKRFLLLVLILDRAKCQSSIPLKYSIDGVDGGSPLLFTTQSGIKSSCQVIQDFLSSDIMHGEGNILAHLVIVGHKVSYQQCPLIEYDFRVTDLFVDLQDGVRLCRAIQLLQHDSSILTKIVVPSDTRKKNLANCGIALQYLRQAGVSLCDEDGMIIVGDDVANGDRELTLSLLWNIFVHFQLPLLVNKTILLEEICKVRGINMDNSNCVCVNSTHLEMLLNWIQAICENYGFKIEKFSSLVDGRAIWCLLDYYFRKDLHCSCSLELLYIFFSIDPQKAGGRESIMSAIDYPDAVHNFIFSQKLTTLLGNFPEVLQISDILEYNGACSYQSVAILLVFLASQLVIKKNMNQLNFHKFLGCDCLSPERKHSCLERCSVSSEAVQNQEETDWHSTEDAVRKFKVIQAWWQNMAEQTYKPVTKVAPPLPCLSPVQDIISIHRENVAKVIQSHFRRLIERRSFLKMVNAGSFLQIVIRAWLTVRKKSAFVKFDTVKGFSSGISKQSERCRRYFMFVVDRQNFVKLKRSVLLIQQAARNWINNRHHGGNIVTCDVTTLVQVNAAIVVQKYSRGWLARSRYIHEVAQLEKASNLCNEKGASDLQTKAAVKIQLAWKNLIVCRSLHNQHFAATKIQSHFLGWLSRRRFLNERQATIKIQSNFRMKRCWRAYQQYKIAAFSTTLIQSYVRGWIARRGACRRRHLIYAIQRHCRSWLIRRDFLFQREAATKIQSAIRCMICWKTFQCQRHAAIEIQRFARGHISRNRLQRMEFLFQIEALRKIQSAIRGMICWKKFQCQRHAAIEIQRFVRGHISRNRLRRREFLFQREAVVKIQSVIRCMICWKTFQCQRRAAIEIQQFVRGHISRNRLLGSSSLRTVIPSGCLLKSSRGCFGSIELEILLCSVLKVQRWWKGVLLLKLRAKYAVIIQSHIRAWFARRNAAREKHHIVFIQSYWKGYLRRKELRGQLLDLRLRVRKSSTNVDDSRRLINRLLSAVAELLSMKSVSGILHTCATLGELRVMVR